MAIAVEMPKLGNSVEECLVSRWVKRKGETVAAGELVAEIETDKATFEVTSPADGTLLATFFEEGALVPVFTNLFVIGAAGEDVEAFRPGQSEAPQAVAAAAAPVEAAAPVPVVPAEGTALSPRARKFAADHNFHPEAVAGSGPGGRVLEQDLRALYESAGTPVPAIRQKIAQRMRESLASTAQYTLNSSADARGLLSLRARIKASAGIVNINDLVCLAAIRALRIMPELNAEFVDGRIRQHADVHLGFACDTPRGLMVPVIRNAQRMSAGELAAAAKDLTARALKGAIGPDELSGATFTVSNLGGLGIESFTPLINPPQVAILGVGAIQLKPVRAAGGIEFMDAIGLSLTCDHQVIDGAPGARFLKVVAEQIETVESWCAIP